MKAALEKPPAPAPNPFGRRLAQAASAFWTDALFVLSVVDVVGLAPEDPLGNVTPWSFKQLRYAAEAALEKPPVLVPNPFGRRLAHAADAFWNAGELKLPPVGNPPVGKLPPVAPAPNPPNFTPCFCMHAANATDDAFGLLPALVAAVVVDVVEEVALDDPPPQALNATEPASTIASRGNQTRRTDRTRKAGDNGPLRRMVLRMLGAPFGSQIHIHPVSTFRLTKATKHNGAFGVGTGVRYGNRISLDPDSGSKL